MKNAPGKDLSRRERQIMDILFETGEATVAQIAEILPDPPTHTAVRTFLRILEEKGQVRRRKDGKRHVYAPAGSKKRAARAAFSDVLSVFFGNSLTDAVAAHLADPKAKLNEEELARLSKLIAEARKKERNND
jgi:BlaI family penicillinase repressor